ncbi:MAG TPA: TonB-dependent receptor [Bacteroidota bacterium]|nr:TonB-dependent receptor [Bacteroidota bacterium]
MKLTLCLLLGLPLGAVAQTTGSISGKVVDSKTGEGLPSVNVLVKGTYYGASSDIDGNFSIPKVNPGEYTISITLLGYKAVEYTGVKVETGKPTTLSVKLEESALTLGKEVVIIGEKPLFDIEQTSSSRTVSSEDLKVSAVRTVQDAVGLQTGVVQSDNQIHIRGSRGYENAYLVDGVPVQDILGGTGFGLQVSPDAIQEMEVITGGYSAEYGQATSGVINITTKEGSTSYHGGAAYKTDRIWGNSLANFNTDILSLNLGGPVPLATLVLPGELSFFATGNANVTDGYTRWVQVVGQNGWPIGYESVAPRRLISSIFYGSRFTPRIANDYSWSGKVTWKPEATEKLSYSYNQSVTIDQNSSTIQTALEYQDPQPGYQYQFKNILDSANTFTQINIQQTLAWTHTLSQKAFYEIRLSRYTAHVRGDANGNDYTHYNQPQDIVTYPIQYYNLGKDTVGVIPGDGFYDTGGPFEWRDHFINDYSVKADFTNHFTEKNKFKTGIESHFQNLQMIDITDPWIKPLGLNNDIYNVSPASGDLYAQDNLTLNGMILNFGLRFDYWFPGKYVDDAVNNPNIPLASDAIRQQYIQSTFNFFGHRWKGRLSPRLGISHPVSDNQTLFFSYGHFSKLPQPTYVYSKLTSSSAQSTEQTIGNPNLNPETTVAYELGLRNQITEDDVLTVTAYYKDIFDYITARSVQATSVRFSSGTYTTYINSDYARNRGIELEYSKRIHENFHATLSGSYSIATGKSSAANQALYNLVTAGVETTIKETYMPWDRPVQGSLTLNYKVPKNEPLFDFAPGVLDNYSVFVRFFYESGMRYTPLLPAGFDNTGRALYVTDYNNIDGSVGQNWFYINLNIDKDIDLGGARMTLSLEVENVLNDKNTQIVNAVTGRAFEYGDNTTGNDPRYPQLQGTISPYPYNPARYLTPRTAKVGVGIQF